MSQRTLRDYQKLSIDRVLAELEIRGSTLLVLPTGCGKTVVMAKLADGWGRGNVLLLAHRIELLDQAADKLESELGYRPVVEQAQRGMDTGLLWQGGCVLVASIQTLANPKRREKFRNCPFDLILIDECHRATAPSYQTVVNYFRGLNPRLKVLGVTATPNRADNLALGIVFDSLAYRLGMREAIEDGWLVPIRQEYVAIEGVDFDSVASAKNEHGESDLKASDLEDILDTEEALHAVVKPILEKCGDKQAIVFSSGVKHAHDLAALLNRYRSGSAVAIDGKTDKLTVRPRAIADYNAGKVQFLCNFGVFTEGFDAPSTGVIVMGRPTKSVGLYTQMLGRGTRPLPGVVDGPASPEARRRAIAMSDKSSMLVLDFVGNSRHKLVSSPDVLGGDYDQEVRERAKAAATSKPGSDMMRELERAKAELELLAEQERRRKIKASVNYTTSEVDPFGDGAAPAAHSEARGGASDGQIAFLVNLGVDRRTAESYGRRQAGAVIDGLKQKRCTDKQKATLSRYGLPTDVNFEQASNLIQKVADNGWRPLPAESAVAG